MIATMIDILFIFYFFEKLFFTFLKKIKLFFRQKLKVCFNRVNVKLKRFSLLFLKSQFSKTKHNFCKELSTLSNALLSCRRQTLLELPNLIPKPPPPQLLNIQIVLTIAKNCRT